MSDNEDKEVKPLSEDLRRSKRNKFRLDVVAVLNRRSPDYRRIGPKFDSLNKTSFKPKDANNGRNAFNLAPVLEPVFPILNEEKSISEISPSTPPHLETPTKRSSEENGVDVTPVKHPKVEVSHVDDLAVKTELKLSPPVKAIVCYKCKTHFKSNAGLGKHVKTCKKYVNSEGLSMPLGFSDVSNDMSIQSNSSGKREDDDMNGLDDSMPILTPECSLKAHKRKNAAIQKSFAHSTETKARVKRINAQSSTPFDIQKALSLKLEIPQVPKVIVDSPANSDYFYCSKCPYKTRDQNLFGFHKSLHDDHTRTYQCTLCSYSCLSPEALHNHLNLHAPALSPNTATTLRKHIIANKRNGILHNDFTPPTSNMIQRMEQVQTQQQRLVSIIKRSGGDEHIHKRIKTQLPVPSTKFYSCRRCSFRTERKENLIFHEELHGRGLLYTCHHCDYSSNSSKVRDYHVKNHHFEASLTTHAINLAVNILKQKTNEIGRSHSAPVEDNKCSTSQLEINDTIESN